MPHEFNYTISESDCRTTPTLLQFLRKNGYSHHILVSMKPDPEAVLVNGKKEFMSYTLRPGDLVRARIPDEQPAVNNDSIRTLSHTIVPNPVPFGIVYEDNDILVVDKPANTPIHPSMDHYTDTLANGVMYYYQQQGRPFVYRCINRLDRDTSGLLIIAKHALSASILSEMMQRREIHRTYLALVEGQVTESGTVDLPIARKEGSVIERCVDMERGECAVTHYRPINKEVIFPENQTKDNSHLAENAARDGEHGSDVSDVVDCGPKEYTLLQLQLETGRTHQIRVHMAAIGHPLLGDTMYNPAYKADAMQRQALHSWKLEFLHPIKKEAVHFTAPLPNDFKIFI